MMRSVRSYVRQNVGQSEPAQPWPIARWSGTPRDRCGLADAHVLANVATGRNRPRRGLALLAAIVCILVLSAISVSLVRTVLARVREAGLHEHQLQADALAQSALDRGMALRTANPEYVGEVWVPEVSGFPRLQANIEWIDTPAGGSLRVVCLVPADAAQPVRLERSVPFPSPPPVKAE